MSISAMQMSISAMQMSMSIKSWAWRWHHDLEAVLHVHTQMDAFIWYGIQFQPVVNESGMVLKSTCMPRRVSVCADASLTCSALESDAQSILIITHYYYSLLLIITRRARV